MVTPCCTVAPSAGTINSPSEPRPYPSMAQQFPNTITLPGVSQLGAPLEEIVISAKDSSERFHTWAFNRDGLITYGYEYPNRVQIVCPDARVAPIAHKLVTCLNAFDVTTETRDRFETNAAHVSATAASDDTGGSGSTLRVRCHV